MRRLRRIWPLTLIAVNSNHMLQNNRLDEHLKLSPDLEVALHYKETLEKRIQELSGEDTEDSEPQFYTIAELREQYNSEPKPQVNSTGWKELDRVCAGGIAEGEVVLLAGQSGIGKTHFGVNIAINYAKRDKRVFYVTLEDGWKMVYERFEKMDPECLTDGSVFMMHEERFTMNNAQKILERGIQDADLIILDNLFAVPLKTPKGGQQWETQAAFVDMVCNMIRSTRSSAIIMHHLNKAPDGSNLERYQIAGSTRLVNRVGQVWLLFHSDKYQDTKGVMGLKVEKNRRSMNKGDCYLKSNDIGVLVGIFESQVAPELLKHVKTLFSIDS